MIQYTYCNIQRLKTFHLDIEEKLQAIVCFYIVSLVKSQKACRSHQSSFSSLL